MNTLFQKINNNLAAYSSQKYPLDERTWKWILHLCQISIKQFINVEEYIFKNAIFYEKMNLNDSLNIVANFYKEIDENLYHAFLNQMYNADYTKFQINSTKNNRVRNQCILLDLHENTSDSFCILHEASHKIFQPFFGKKVIDDNRYPLLFSENLPFFLERKFNEKIDIDKNKFLYDRLINLIEASVICLFTEWMLKIYKENNQHINPMILRQEIEKITDPFFRQVVEKKASYLLVNLAKSTIYKRGSFSKYILAGVLAPTLYKNVKEEKWTLPQFLKKMSTLNTINSFEEGLDILELNYLKDKNVIIKLEENFMQDCENMIEVRKKL